EEVSRQEGKRVGGPITENPIPPRPSLTMGGSTPSQQSILSSSPLPKSGLSKAVSFPSRVLPTPKGPKKTVPLLSTHSKSKKIAPLPGLGISGPVAPNVFPRNSAGGQIPVGGVGSAGPGASTKRSGVSVARPGDRASSKRPTGKSAA